MMEEGRWGEFLEWLDASGLMEEKVGAPAAQLRQRDNCVRVRCGVVERVWPLTQDGALQCNVTSGVRSRTLVHCWCPWLCKALSHEVLAKPRDTCKHTLAVPTAFWLYSLAVLIPCCVYTPRASAANACMTASRTAFGL